MDTRQIGVLAGVVSAVSVVAQVMPGWFLGRWIDSGQQGLPLMFGTVGETVVTYNYLFDIIGPLVTVFLAASLGYYAGRHHDAVVKYRRFIGAVGIGSLVSVLIVGGGFVVWTSSGSIVLGLLVILSLVVSVSLVVTVGMFAGAALAQFRMTGGSPAQPASTGPTAETPTADTTTDHADQHTQPTR